MKRILGVVVILAVAFAHVPVFALAPGVITGTVTGNAGPLSGVTVQVLNAAGHIVGTAATTATGSFRAVDLAAGTFSVNVVGASGAVLSTATATLAAGAMTAILPLRVSVAALAGAGAAAQIPAAGAGGLSTTAIVVTVVAVAAGVGAAAYVANRGSSSPSR